MRTQRTLQRTIQAVCPSLYTASVVYLAFVACKPLKVVAEQQIVLFALLCVLFIFFERVIE